MLSTLRDSMAIDRHRSRFSSAFAIALGLIFGIAVFSATPGTAGAQTTTTTRTAPKPRTTTRATATKKSAQEKAKDAGPKDAAPEAEAKAPEKPPEPAASVPPPPPPASAPPPKPRPRPPPAASAPLPTGAEVRLHDVPVFVVRVPHGRQSAAERAASATKNLQESASEVRADAVRVEVGQGVAVVYAGKSPIIQLFPEDAKAAGDASLEVHAATIAARLREAIEEEAKRSAIAKTVLNICLAIVFLLVTVYVLRKIGEFASRFRAWLQANPERLSALRLRSFEVVGPAALRGGVDFSVSIGKWVLQIGIVYAYLLIVFSLFAATRRFSERLTGFVLTPLSELISRIASAVPVIVVLLVATVVVVVLVRFVRLFFAAVSRGETHLEWLPGDLAEPTSVLLRIGVVFAAVVFAAPVVTGQAEGSLARAGMVALVTLGVASTPLIATGIVGIGVVYWRRLRVGEYAEFGGRVGKVQRVGLLEVLLEDNEGCQVRVPHLLSLVRPTRLIGSAPRVAIQINVDPRISQEQVRAVLLQAASRVGQWPSAEIIGLDADAARHRVTICSASPDAPNALWLAVAKALSDARIALARTTHGAAGAVRPSF